MPIQSVLIPCGSRMIVDVDGATSACVKIGDSVFTVDGGSERSVGPFAADVTCSIDYTGYPSIYLTDEAGAITAISLPLPDPESLPAGTSVEMTGEFAADVTSVLLTVDYVKGVKSWTGTVVSASDPVNADGLPDGVTWIKV